MAGKRMIAAMALLLAASAGTALAEPMLQLYLEGATYDTESETWVITNGEGPARLWVIGNTSTPKGSIEGVKLAIAYAANQTPTFTFTGSTTGGYGGFTDPSTAEAPTYLQTVTDGSSPLLSDGTSLPTHGIFGPGTAWQEFSLGNFTLTDSPIADFIGSFPSPTSKMGQINVYDITIEGASVVHFDAYNHFEGETLARFAPFSHDSGTVPAPAAALLAMIGIGTTGLLRRYIR